MLSMIRDKNHQAAKECVRDVYENICLLNLIRLVGVIMLKCVLQLSPLIFIKNVIKLKCRLKVYNAHYKFQCILEASQPISQVFFLSPRNGMLKWKIFLIWSRGKVNKFFLLHCVLLLLTSGSVIIIRMIQFVFKFFVIRFGYFILLYYMK